MRRNVKAKDETKQNNPTQSECEKCDSFGAKSFEEIAGEFEFNLLKQNA